MESVIIKPKNALLRKYVQYFLFFKKTDSEFLSYSTFPNNNLCLAIYKQNAINHVKQADQNNCIITSGRRHFTSRLFGFHKTPFDVEINAALDQVCILFYPAALRVFTGESYTDLLDANHVFDIFKRKNDFILEQIFAENDFSKRSEKLEQLLLANLNDRIPVKLKEGLCIIENSYRDNLSIETLTDKLGMSSPTLFRLFKDHVGLNPKSYLKTLRFRNSLNEVLNQQCSLTDTAYSYQYYDQAHFIKDFKHFSSHSPNQLIRKITVEQNQLAWIYNQKKV